jgi:WD40 repeat protein
MDISKHHLIIGSDDGILRLYNMNHVSTSSEVRLTARQIHLEKVAENVADSEVVSLCLSGDYQSIVVGTSDGGLYTVKIQGYKEAMIAESELENSPYNIQMIADSHSFLVTGMEVLPLTEESALQRHDRNLLVTCGLDGTLRLWDYKSNALLTKRHYKASFTSLSCEATGKRIYLGTSLGYLRIMEIDNQNNPQLIFAERLRKSPIVDVKCGGAENSIVVVAFEDNFMAFVRTKRLAEDVNDDEVELDEQKTSITLLGFVKFPDRITAVTWLVENKLYVATDSGDIYTINHPADQSTANDMTFLLNNLTQDLFKFDFTSYGIVPSKDNSMKIYTISRDKTIKYYELAETDLATHSISSSAARSPTSEIECHFKVGKCITMSPDGQLLATAGQDGVAWIRKAIKDLDTQPSSRDYSEHRSKDQVALLCSHDPSTGGVTKICFSTSGSHFFTAGCDGTIFVYSILDEEPSEAYIAPRFSSLTFNQKAPPEEHVVAENANDPTFIEIKAAELLNVNRLLNESQKEYMREEVGKLRKEFLDIKLENETAPEDERLVEDDFIIDYEYKTNLEEVAKKSLDELKTKVKEENLKSEFIANRIKAECWDQMEQHITVLQGFKYVDNTPGEGSAINIEKVNQVTQPNVQVANFVIRKANPEYEKLLQKIKFMRRLEELDLITRRVDSITYDLEGGLPDEDEILHKKEEVEDSIEEKSEKSEKTEDEEEKEQDDDDYDDAPTKETLDVHSKKKHQVYSQMAREDSQLLYPTFDLYTRQRRVTQIHLLNSQIRKMMLEYNEKFYDVQQSKDKVITKIGQINERIIEILKELETTNKEEANVPILIFNPTIPASEKPETILEVLDSEIPDKSKYISTSDLEQQQEKERLEQERIAKDNNQDLAERALQMMMDGRLEITTAENTNEHELQPPECYYKEKSKLTESEIKEIRNYEAQVKLKKEEEIKRRKQLEAKLKNARQEISDLCNNFDESLKQLLKQKLSTDGSIYEVELRVIKLAQFIIQQEESEKNEQQLNRILDTLKSRKATSATALQEYKKEVETFKNSLDSLIAEDKNLERSFKSKFPDTLAAYYSSNMHQQYMAQQQQQQLLQQVQPSVQNSFASSQSNDVNLFNQALNNSVTQPPTNPAPTVPGKKGNPSGTRQPQEMFDKLYKMYRNRPKIKTQQMIDMEISNKAEFRTDPFADIDIGLEIKNAPLVDPVDKIKDKPPGLSDQIWERFWEHRVQKIVSDQQVRVAQTTFDEMMQQLERLKQEDLELERIMSKDMTELNEFRDKLVKESFNLDYLFKFKQGQVEVPQAAVVTDYSDAILISKSTIQELNSSIRSHGEEKIKQMHKSKQVRKLMKKVEWENEVISFDSDEMNIKYKRLQMLRVTKEMQDLIKGGGTEKKKEAERKRLDKQIVHVHSDLQSKLRDKKKTMKKMESQMQERYNENVTLSEQFKMLDTLVRERQELHELHATSKDSEQSERKMREIRQEKKLRQIIDENEVRLNILRQEIDRLRQRSFPSFAVVQKRKFH